MASVLLSSLYPSEQSPYHSSPHIHSELRNHVLCTREDAYQQASSWPLITAATDSPNLKTYRPGDATRVSPCVHRRASHVYVFSPSLFILLTFPTTSRTASQEQHLSSSSSKTPSKPTLLQPHYIPQNFKYIYTNRTPTSRHSHPAPHDRPGRSGPLRPNRQSTGRRGPTDAGTARQLQPGRRGGPSAKHGRGPGR